MPKKSRSFWSGSGPYVVFALCLLAAGLLGARIFTPQEEETPVPEEPVIHEVYTPAAEVSEQVPLAVSEEDAPVLAPTEESAPSAPEEPRSSYFTSPLSGETIAAFSTDALCYNEALADWRTHNGIDIAAEVGSPVSAAAPGTVKSVIDDPLLGTTVTVEHEGGYCSIYASLDKEVYVSAGDSVQTGDRIGTVGTTAAGESAEPHLHFSVSRDGKLLDPAPLLG